MSYGYLVTGILPVQIAFPSLLCMLLGSAAQESLLEKFINSVSAEERKTMQQAHKEKDESPNYLQGHLGNILVVFN